MPPYGRAFDVFGRQSSSLFSGDVYWWDLGISDRYVVVIVRFPGGRRQGCFNEWFGRSFKDEAGGSLPCQLVPL